MTPILLITWLIKFIATLFAIRNKLKLIYIFLIGNLILDVFCQLIKYTHPQISIFLYIANAAWLMFCSGAQVNNKPICYASVLALGSVFVACSIAYSYPVLLAFYAASALISLTFIVINIFKKPNFNTGILMMLNIGCLLEVFIISKFGPDYYFLINTANICFYLSIIGVGATSQKYENLLKKLLK